jgi:hypothetical protein
MAIVDIGDAYPITVLVKDAGEQPVDVDRVEVEVTLPDGTTTAPVIAQRAGPGRYEVDHEVTAAGQHTWTATSFGEIEGSWTGTFIAEPRLSIVSVEEAIAHMAASGVLVGGQQLEQLAWLCQVATDAVERDLGQVLVRRLVTETHPADRPSIVLWRQPVVSVASVTVDGVTADAAGWALDSFGILHSRNGWGATGWHTGRCEVTYVAGPPAGQVAPPIARKVALNGIQRMWARSQQVPLQYADQIGDEAIAVSSGVLTPLELDGYRSLRRSAVA